MYMAGLFKKSLLHEQNFQKSLQIPNFQFSSKLKIQADSILKTSNVLENWMKSLWKQSYNSSVVPFHLFRINTFFVETKMTTTQIWPSGVLDYSNRNDNWTTTQLSYISLMKQYYFFVTSINYNEKKKSHSKKKITKIQKRCNYVTFQTMNSMTSQGTI